MDVRRVARLARRFYSVGRGRCCAYYPAGHARASRAGGLAGKIVGPGVNNYCAPYYRLNDPLEGQFLHAMHFPANEAFPKTTRRIALTSIDQMIDPENYFDIRGCSLSSSLENVRLWSLYGGGHAGIAGGIETDGLPEKTHEVTYSPRLRFVDKPS